MDLWVDPSPSNVRRTNTALAEYGSPHLLAIDHPEEILQIGLPPNRVDLLRAIDSPAFAKAWKRRIGGEYGRAVVNWIDLASLIEIKSRIHDPRHRRDVRDLEAVRALKSRASARPAAPPARPPQRKARRR